MSTNFLTYSRRKWRDAGYYVEGTESIVRLPGGITRRDDLFGFTDLLAVPMADFVDDGNGIALALGAGEVEVVPAFVYLQVTSRSNMSARLRKIQNGTTGKGQWERPMADIARAVLERGDRIVIEGWDQPNGSGTRWRDKERELTLEDLE